MKWWGNTLVHYYCSYKCFLWCVKHNSIFSQDFSFLAQPHPLSLKEGKEKSLYLFYIKMLPRWEILKRKALSPHISSMQQPRSLTALRSWKWWEKPKWFQTQLWKQTLWYLWSQPPHARSSSDLLMGDGTMPVATPGNETGTNGLIRYILIKWTGSF